MWDKWKVMRGNPYDKKIQPFHVVIIAVAVSACLVPFSGKAFNIDDTLFIWTAKQILNEPFDFYGFAANWANQLNPAIDIIKNPPLAGYFIAVTALFTGFSEQALHFAFLIPAIGTAIGTYLLALKFTERPVFAALASVITPVFLVSANTVMCDVLMLFFWVWAIVLWQCGLERGDHFSFAAGGLLIAAAALTKYFGMALIPLLFAYSLIYRPRPFRWLAWMLLPIVILAVYQFATEAVYGRGLLLDATSYAQSISAEGPGFGEKTFVGFVFAGGCLITALFFVPVIWRLKGTVIAVMAAVIIAAVILRVDNIGGAALKTEDGYRLDMIAQLAIFATAGLSILALMIRDLLVKRDSASVLLFLWVAGTFVFACYFNWTMNGRSILPMAPAVGILLMRALNDKGRRAGAGTLILPLIPALVISVLVTWADFRLANTARETAESITSKYSRQARAIWFQGHWGFQYYMEAGGASTIDKRNTVVMPGDIVVFPLNNVNLWLMPGDRVSMIESIELDFPEFLTTMSLGPGAGFYAGAWGPLPYMFGTFNKEQYWVLRSTDEIRF